MAADSDWKIIKSIIFSAAYQVPESTNWCHWYEKELVVMRSHKK